MRTQELNGTQQETQRIMQEVWATHPDLSDHDALVANAFGKLHACAVSHLLEEVMPDDDERQVRTAQWMLIIAKTVAALRKDEQTLAALRTQEE